MDSLHKPLITQSIKHYFQSNILLKRKFISAKISFFIHVVDPDQVPSSKSLAHFIRDHLHLKGTKISCNQGGCGACVVKATFEDPATGQQKTRSVNSVSQFSQSSNIESLTLFLFLFFERVQCITPVLKCEGWNITTIEGLGNTHVGMSDVQSRMAAMNGTQCGYCTPGMVMAIDRYFEFRNLLLTNQTLHSV